MERVRRNSYHNIDAYYIKINVYRETNVQISQLIFEHATTKYFLIHFNESFKTSGLLTLCGCN